MSSVIKTSELKNEIDNKKFVITNPKINPTNKRVTCALLHKNGEQANLFAFELPVVRIAFPPNYYGEKDKDTIIAEENKNYSFVVVAYEGSMEDPKNTDNMMYFIDELKNMVIDFGIDHSDKILKKKFTQAQRETMIDTSFSYPVKQKAKPDGTFYPSNITIKIPKNRETNLPDVSVYIDHLGKIEKAAIESWDQLKEIMNKNCVCKAIIRPVISVINKSINFTFRLVQIKVFKIDKVTIPKDYAFSDAPLPVTNTDASADDKPFGIDTVVIESDEDQDDVDVTDA